MEDINTQTNQRFEHLDMTRLRSRLQEGFNHIVAKVFGNPQRYIAPANDWDLRPSIIRPFRLHIQGPATDLTIRIQRYWIIIGGNKHEALAFDKDGNRIGTSSDPAAIDLVVAATPYATPRYVQARCVRTPSNNESRHFYTEAAGHYQQAIDTTIDEVWEVQENTTSADTDPVLRDAGWINIGDFQTSGPAPDQLTVVNAWRSDMERGQDDLPLSWLSASGPDFLPDLPPGNFFEQVAALYQIVSRMRYGKNTGRYTLADPGGDAAFEEDGGVRFAEGGTIRDAYLRLRDGTATVWDMLVAQPNSPADADDLHHIRGQGVIAGGATTQIDPSLNRGHLYSTQIDQHEGSGSLFPASGYPVKFWPIHPLSAISPANALSAAAGDDLWTWITTGEPLPGTVWNNGGAGRLGNWLQFPICLPEGARITDITFDIDCVIPFVSANLILRSEVIYRKKLGHPNPAALVTHVTKTRAGNLVPFAAGGTYTWSALTSPGDTPIIVSSGDTGSGKVGEIISVRFQLDDTAGAVALGVGNCLYISNGCVRYTVREASHVHTMPADGVTSLP